MMTSQYSFSKFSRLFREIFELVQLFNLDRIEIRLLIPNMLGYIKLNKAAKNVQLGSVM